MLYLKSRFHFHHLWIRRLPKELNRARTAVSTSISSDPFSSLPKNDLAGSLRIEDSHYLRMQTRVRGHRQFCVYRIPPVPIGDHFPSTSDHRNKRGDIPRMHDRITHNIRPSASNQKISVAITPSADHPHSPGERVPTFRILMECNVECIGRKQCSFCEGFCAAMCIGAPFGVADTVSPTTSCLKTGWWMQPSIGCPQCSRAIKVPKSGQAVAKLLVPSIGSSVQTNSESIRSAPYSSPSTPCDGNRREISRRMISSALRSAAVTGLWSIFHSTASL